MQELQEGSASLTSVLVLTPGWSAGFERGCSAGVQILHNRETNVWLQCEEHQPTSGHAHHQAQICHSLLTHQRKGLLGGGSNRVDVSRLNDRTSHDKTYPCPVGVFGLTLLEALVWVWTAGHCECGRGCKR